MSSTATNPFAAAQAAPETEPPLEVRLVDWVNGATAFVVVAVFTWQSLGLIGGLLEPVVVLAYTAFAISFMLGGVAAYGMVYWHWLRQLGIAALTALLVACYVGAMVIFAYRIAAQDLWKVVVPYQGWIHTVHWLLLFSALLGFAAAIVSAACAPSDAGALRKVVILACGSICGLYVVLWIQSVLPML